MKRITSEEMIKVKAERLESLLLELKSGFGKKMIKYMDGVPASYKRSLLEAYTGKKKKANAIKAKCLDCSCFQRSEIENCETLTCPLWHYRPYKK